jgi:SAM-dependent methyltransferase
VAPAEWWPFDNNDWYRYYAPRRIAALTEQRMADERQRAERDLDAVVARTGLRTSSRILEIGCGWGRHSQALAQRGIASVVSIDIAPDALERARHLARAAQLRCDFRLQDFRFVEDGPFAAVLSLYDRSVCGFPTEEDDARSLRRVAQILQPGGWLVFGIDDWPRDLPSPSSRWEDTSEGRELIETIPDRTTMTTTHRVTVMRPDSRSATYALRRRHYSLVELTELLASAGFTLIAAFRRLADEEPYDGSGEGLFIYARRS